MWAEGGQRQTDTPYRIKFKFIRWFMEGKGKGEKRGERREEGGERERFFSERDRVMGREARC